MTSYIKIDQWETSIHCNWPMVRFILASHKSFLSLGVIFFEGTLCCLHFQKKKKWGMSFFFLGEIYLGVVSSSKIAKNLSWTYEKLHFKGEPIWNQQSTRSFNTNRHKNYYIRISFDSIVSEKFIKFCYNKKSD